ncbi:MAG: hypothetical protein BLM47_06015 [Candidatus Reconcilbacillus cellulovorans]|uniref:DUF2264 domain-containing protein n=1 Tax=Candidatus Reconcilbacillus cellulovorans TaxID=1906605 RepID=A0A2A6E0Z2_9BACL|nr:MAG: hypothetical protein BLM47_06015 [Candidatus Reconcilbacillus cellulovorans]
MYRYVRGGDAVGAGDRAYWVETLCRIAEPVLGALAERKLKASMPVEASDAGRAAYTHLEALGRVLAGIAPWLENISVPAQCEEGRLQRRFADLARRAIDAATDPDSPDFVNFTEGDQPIVDAAFLATAVLRAPRELWEHLDGRVRRNLADALEATRTRRPHFSNWLLFAAAIEAALCRMGRAWDPMRVDYALKQHDQWYVGDGAYSDGPEFHWDYYNSFVIHPLLLEVLDAVGDRYDDWKAMRDRERRRSMRYSAVLERLIAPDGTFPPIGRSIAYRFGAFHALAAAALRRELDPSLAPNQVRCALTAVIRRTLEAPGNFDENGWLRIGLCGHQPWLGERYISTGSLYLCATVFLPLGLPPDDPFWQGEADWTSKRLWSGGYAPIDRAMTEFRG